LIDVTRDRAAARRNDDDDLPELPGETPRERWRPPTLATAAYPNWEAIYNDNVARVYRLMFAKVGNRPDAEDLTSEVFLTAYRPLRTTASVGEVRTYLVATARTVLADHWRRTLGHQITEIDPGQVDLRDFAAPGPVEGTPGTVERVSRILDSLPERQRAILSLRFLHGYTIKQAASELGITVGNAKVLQHRALRHAAGLEKEGDGR
jgi:RNA polymerase sigma-70 factor (ECF subfamily)